LPWPGTSVTAHGLPDCSLTQDHTTKPRSHSRGTPQRRPAHSHGRKPLIHEPGRTYATAPGGLRPRRAWTDIILSSCGELITPLPVGLARDAAGHVVLDPDAAVQKALTHLFTTFTATGSARACVKAFGTAGLAFPRRHRKGPRKGELDWAPLQYSAVLRVLHNPRYAGAFCFGRHREVPRPGGTTLTQTLPREEWIALIPGAHPGYITIEEFDANQARLAESAAAHGTDRKAGPPREGPALLQGIAMCGRCGQRMTIRYHALRDRQQPDYVCQRAGIEHGTPICQSIRGAGIDAAIGELLIGALTPLAVEAALTVAAELQNRASQADALRAAHVERARYHADLARRRYLAVDPANRLVADTLEADWNTALRHLADAQDACDKAREQHAGQLTSDQQARIHQLVTDFPAIWNDPCTASKSRTASDLVFTRSGNAAW
jgi:hypothetical protein